MGLFLAMSGVAGATKEAVERSLRHFASNAKQDPQSELATEDILKGSIIVEAPGNKVTVLYPDGFMEWDAASAHISSEFRLPVFSFHIHDGDFWMYILHVDGEEVGHFNPIPEYWDDRISQAERQKWSGDASVICSHWPEMAAENIKNYLVHWDLEKLSLNPTQKAYPDDKFPLGLDWQLCDFMKKLGLIYPIDQNGNPIGSRSRLSDSTSSMERPQDGNTMEKIKKPWWKLW
ncbi:MAG: hypothetical protein JWR26_3697 [Pedosphaera sp.]|nr:hypothetical protein [Pedosphaera sp.]